MYCKLIFFYDIFINVMYFTFIIYVRVMFEFIYVKLSTCLHVCKLLSK